MKTGWTLYISSTETIQCVQGNRLASPILLYRVYQKEVNTLKNDSKLKSMNYLVKILFYLDELVSCLPPVAKSLMCDSQ